MTLYYADNYDTIVGSGGGCFPAGTLIRTSHGFRCIDKIRVEELVVGYALHGELALGKVIATHVHPKKEFKDDVYLLYSNGKKIFPEGITGNHAVLEAISGIHVKVSDLNTTDCQLVDLDGNAIPITEIEIIPNEALPIDFKVYNLTVLPQHTFLVYSKDLDTCIRVHNGGGGKGGTAAPAAREAPNTLQSSAKARILEVISHGEIVGVIGGAKGVYFNDTVVENADNSRNFEDVELNFRVGLPSQTHIPGFTNVEAEVVIASTEILAAGVVHQLPNSNVDAARVTISFPEGLWRTNKNTGSLNGFTVSFVIETKERTSGTWNIIVSEVIRDKTVSPTEISYRIPAPVGAVQWDVRARRLSAEDVDSSMKSVIHFERLTEIIEETLSYDNMALVGSIVPAASTGNQIPRRAFDTMGLKIKVPTNMDTTLRTFGAAFWDGTFKTDWTDDPAWIVYDLFTNPEYGVANFLGQPIDIDIWSFYEASLYNNAATWTGSAYVYNLLDDGEGGTEVRFTYNNAITTQEDTWQLIHAICSSMRAVPVDRGGQIALLQDRPRVPTRIFNNSNVIDGSFVYTGTDAAQRHTVVHATFNDKDDNYLPRPIVEQASAPVLAKFGSIVASIVAYGAVKESEARRQAKWFIESEQAQNEIVTFTVSLNIVDIEVGEVIYVMDNDYVSSAIGFVAGRISNITGAVVTLDREVTLQVGWAYKLHFYAADYSSIIEANVLTGAGTTTTLTLDVAPPAGNYTDKEFYVWSTGNVEPRQFIVQQISETQKGVYTVSALQHDPTKYARVEQGLVVVPTTFPTIFSSILPPVDTVTFQEVFLNNGIQTENYILVKWLWNETSTVKDAVTFNLRWRKDDGIYQNAYDIAKKDFQIPSIEPGVYEVIIEAYGTDGRRSVSTVATYNYRVTPGTSTLQPPENFFVKDTAGTAFVGDHIPVTWTFPIANETTLDTLFDYVVELWTSDGLTLKGTYVVKPDAARNGSFDYLLEFNKDDFGVPTRQVQMKVYSRDMAGDLSLPVTKNFTNAVPAAPSFSVVSGTSINYVSITPSTDDDLAGYIIYRSETMGFTPGPGDIIYDGPDSEKTFKGAAGVTYYFVVTAYDRFGKTGLNLSAEQSTTTLSGDVPVWVFTGLLFKPNDPATNSVSWTAGEASVDGALPTTINAGNAAWTAGILYIYYSGSGSTLSATTDLAIAVTGAMILATYKGGTNLIVGNGDAFQDGGLILANTVGANQLVTDSAIITNVAQLANAIIRQAHIQDGEIVNAKIGAIIQSSNFSDISFLGWQIDKAGNIKSYGTLEIRDSSGNVVLSAGGSPTFQWGSVTGTGKPDDNADVTLDNTAGRGVNVANPRYSLFDPFDLADFIINNVTASQVTDGYVHSKALQLVVTGADPYIHFGTSGSDFNIVIEPLKKWLISIYTKSTLASANFQIFVFKSGGGNVASTGLTQHATPGTWVRHVFLLDLSADTSTAIQIRIDCNNTGLAETVVVDGLMVEEAVGTLNIPSAYYEPAQPGATKGALFDEAVNTVENAEAVTFTEGLTDYLPSIEKTAGGTSWNGSAYSSVGYTSGCVARAFAVFVTAQKVFGLDTNPSANANQNSIEYGFYLRDTSRIDILESGTNRGQFGTYSQDTVLAIIYDNANIRYFIDGVEVRTVAVAAGQQFFWDCSINTVGDKLVDVQFHSYTAGVEGTENTTLTVHQNVTITQLTDSAITTTSNSITKTAGEAAWDASAWSNQSYEDCVLRFQPGQTNTDKIMGLSTNPSSINTQMELAFRCDASGNLFIYEDGNQISAHGTYLATTVLEIIVGPEGGVEYKKDSVSIRTREIDLGIFLFLDSEFFTVGGSFTNIEFHSRTTTVTNKSNVTGQISKHTADVYIGSAAIRNAQVGFAQIDTLELKGQAVVIPVNAFTEGLIAVPEVVDGELVIQEATIISSGAPILILSSFAVSNSIFYSGSSPFNIQWGIIFDIEILRNDTTVVGGIGNANPNTDVFLVDQPGLGTFTYKIRIRTKAFVPASAPFYAFNRSLTLLEVKR